MAVSEEKFLDTQLDECLDTWGISSVEEWDLLAFLHGHRQILVTLEQISRLLGYREPIVRKALEKMEKAGLVQRSRSSRDVRFYGLIKAVNVSNQGCFELLLQLFEKPLLRSLVVSRLAHAPAAGRGLLRTGLYLT
jgi:hypothetical protein